MQPIENLSNSANRISLYNKFLPTDLTLPTHHTKQVQRQQSATTIARSHSGSVLQQQSRPVPQEPSSPASAATPSRPVSPSARCVPHPPAPVPVQSESYPGPRGQQPSISGTTYAPIVDSVTNAMRDPNLPPIELPPPLTADDFTRAVAAATVSALRHQQNHEALRHHGADAHDGAHGGHDGPSWSRLVSANVLLGCTVLYAIIAGKLLSINWTVPSSE